jgi:quercetin dioxygenase-like cupin family protein
MESLRAVHGTAASEAYWGPGDRYTFLLTGEQCGGAMFAFDCVVAPGGGPPPHRHLAEDELFFLYGGAVEFSTGGERRTIAAGESIFVPKGLAHEYRNEREDNALMLAIYTPAGMEGWFREVFERVADPSGQPPPVTDEMIGRMLEAGPRYNVEWIGE